MSCRRLKTRRRWMAEHFGINIKVENKEIADYLRNAKTVTFGLVENLVGKV